MCVYSAAECYNLLFEQCSTVRLFLIRFLHQWTFSIGWLCCVCCSWSIITRWIIGILSYPLLFIELDTSHKLRHIIFPKQTWSGDFYLQWICTRFTDMFFFILQQFYLICDFQYIHIYNITWISFCNFLNNNFTSIHNRIHAGASDCAVT